MIKIWNNGLNHILQMDLWKELNQWLIAEYILVNIMNYIILSHKWIKKITIDKENKQTNKSLMLIDFSLFLKLSQVFIFLTQRASQLLLDNIDNNMAT